jgi:hypothetical protein
VQAVPDLEGIVLASRYLSVLYINALTLSMAYRYMYVF